MLQVVRVSSRHVQSNTSAGSNSNARTGRQLLVALVVVLVLLVRDVERLESGKRQ